MIKRYKNKFSDNSGNFKKSESNNSFNFKNSSKKSNNSKQSYKFMNNKIESFKESEYIKSKPKDKKNFNLRSDNSSHKDSINLKNKNIDDLIWGKHSVLEVLKSGKPINRIWCTSEVRLSEKFFLILKEIKNKGVLIEEVNWSRISQMTYGAVHQGIVLQIAYSHTLSLKTLINSINFKSSQTKLICLDGITDPHNVGAIIRSAEAFGCAGVVIPQRRSAGITGTVAKVSAGALEHISVSRVVNLNRALEELKNAGFIIVGLTANASLNISNFSEKSPMVLVVGSEGKGLSLLTQKNCDYLVRIPLKGKTSSLNASVAAAISLFKLS